MTQDFKEFIESLNAHKVRYMIIGGYALAFIVTPHPNPPRRGGDFSNCLFSLHF